MDRSTRACSAWIPDLCLAAAMTDPYPRAAPSLPARHAFPLSRLAAMSLRAVTAATIAVLVGMVGALSSALPPAATAAPAPPDSPSPTAAGPDRPFRTAPAPQRMRRGGPIGAGKLKRKLKNLARQAPGASGYYVFDLDAKGNRVLFDRSGGTRASSPRTRSCSRP